MKDEHRKKIREYRMSGKGFRLIAKELDLKLDAVREFCRNNGLAGPAEYVKFNHYVWSVNNHKCPVCGKKVRQPKRGRSKIFCSGKCRTRHCRSREPIENTVFPKFDDFPMIEL